MKDLNSSLCFLKLIYIKKEIINSFLNLIGISFIDGEVFSSRNIEVFLICYSIFIRLFDGLQAYKTDHKLDWCYFLHIFDGLCEIKISVDEEDDDDIPDMSLTLHEDQESVEDEKEEMKSRIEVIQQ